MADQDSELFVLKDPMVEIVDEVTTIRDLLEQSGSKPWSCEVVPSNHDVASDPSLRPNSYIRWPDGYIPGDINKVSVALVEEAVMFVFMIWENGKPVERASVRIGSLNDDTITSSMIYCVSRGFPSPRIAQAIGVFGNGSQRQHNTSLSNQSEIMEGPLPRVVSSISNSMIGSLMQ